MKKARAASINTIRDINRRIVLNYVRVREPVSRVELARETGLQRSTISTIVDALVADRMMEKVGEGESTGADGRAQSCPRAQVCLYLRGIKTDLEVKVDSLQLTMAKSASLKGVIA